MRTRTTDFFVSASITSACNFTLHVKEGTTGIANSFKNSPITLTIRPAATVARETDVKDDYEGTVRIFTFETLDEYGNPTGEESKLRFYLDDDKDGAQPIEAGNTINIDTARTFSGKGTLHVLFEGEEINNGEIISYTGLDTTIIVLIIVFVTIVSLVAR